MYTWVRNILLHLVYNMCDKCKKIKSRVRYKKGKYCTWYCAKKSEKKA